MLAGRHCVTKIRKLEKIVYCLILALRHFKITYFQITLSYLETDKEKKIPHINTYCVDVYGTL